MAANIDPSMVKDLPPALLETLPGGQPPPGVVPNLENPESRVPAIIGVEAAFTAIAFIVIFIRMYTKFAIVKTWKWDDVTISLGFVCCVINFIMTVYGCVDGATGRHEWEVTLKDVISNGSLYQSYVTVIVVTPGLGLIKLSLFIQYYLLFKLRRYVRISVYIGATLATIFYAVVSLTAFIMTSPWPGEEMIDTILSSHYLKFAEFSIPTGVIGLAVDLVLFILPIPAILSLQMSMGKKLGVLLIFLTGGLAVAASATSLYYRIDLQKDSTDTTWKVGYVLLWSHLEMTAGITASCMPTVRQFFARRKSSKSSGFVSSYTPKFSSLRSPSRSGQRELLGGEARFKQWGYKPNSTVDIEDTFASEETAVERDLPMNDMPPKPTVASRGMGGRAGL